MIADKKFDLFLGILKCAAKVNVIFGFILENMENGGFRKFYAHENNTTLDRSTLVCTKDNLAKIFDLFNKTDVIGSCSKRRMNTKLRFHKLTNLTVFAAFLKDLPMGCKDFVLSGPLAK